MPLTDLLSTGQVADLLNVSVATVNRWASDGEIPVAHSMPGRTGPRLYERRVVIDFATSRGIRLPADVEALLSPSDPEATA